MTRFSLALPLIALVACAPPTPLQQITVTGQMTTSSLWVEHSRTTDPLKLMTIEAELGERGEMGSSTRYVGQRTASAVGKQNYARTPQSVASADSRNCSDFSNSGQAQKVFLALGGPISDPHNLDADGDGFACEWGTQVRASVRRAERAGASERSALIAASRCYTGPRGGTYTITASGTRNYDGC